MTFFHQEDRTMSLEEQVYLESLEVLSDMDEHEAVVREALLDTPPSSPYERRQLIFSPLFPPSPPVHYRYEGIPTNIDSPATIRALPIHQHHQYVESSNDDGFYRNNQEAFHKIYSKTVIPDEDNDYCIPFEDLPEYKAYQCVRTLRRCKNKRYVWLTVLVLLISVPVVTRVWNMTSALYDSSTSTTITTKDTINGFQLRSIHIKERLIKGKQAGSTIKPGTKAETEGELLGNLNKTTPVASKNNETMIIDTNTAALQLQQQPLAVLATNLTTTTLP